MIRCVPKIGLRFMVSKAGCIYLELSAFPRHLTPGLCDHYGNNRRTSQVPNVMSGNGMKYVDYRLKTSVMITVFSAS